MRKSLLVLLFIGISLLSFSQKDYPKDYFRKPLDIPLILSGTFGELRSNHFHSGLDIKTQKRTGWNVYASADGYVSRIKISHWGYGKALYITHPNGYVTVYAHLKKFSPKLEEFIKKKQYEKESFEIELFPKKDEIKVSLGEVVAFSGNSGSSGGPHLHYEIRDINAKPINPMHFGIDIPDHKKPQIRAAVAYSFGDSSHVDQTNRDRELSFSKQKNGDLLANKIEAYGTIGFGINVIDKLDGALNNNGIYELALKVNGTAVYKHEVRTFSFAESRYINTHIDYQRFYKKRQRIQKCFIEPSNKLSTYSNLIDKGFLKVEDKASYQVEIIAKDFKGNQQKLLIPIKGKKDSIIIKRTDHITPHYFKTNDFNKISDSTVTVAFPKRSFYKDLYFDFKHEDNVVKLHNQGIPIHKNFTLTFDVSKYPKEEQAKLFIGRLTSKGKPYYSRTRRKPNKLYTLNKTLGNYALFSDNQKPKIKPINFKDNQWLSKYRYLKLRITDNLSGIKSYRAEIDGEWVLMEFNAKTGVLTYDFKDKKFDKEKHTLKLTVADNVNNTNTYIATFFKKQ